MGVYMFSRTSIFRAFLTFAIFFSALGAFSISAQAQAKITGNFEVIGKLPEPNSLSEVKFEEFLNFTCPHCNNFRNLSKDLFKRYGKKLKHVNNPILFRGQNDMALRLFFLAQKDGREEEMKEMIFDASFVFGVNIYDPATIDFLARSAGMGDRYKKNGGDAWVTEKITDAEFRAKEAGIMSTPPLCWRVPSK